MLPHQHVFWGAVFSFALLVVVPQLGYVNALLIFLASFLIDVDHYAASLIRSGTFLSLKQSFEYHMKRGLAQISERKRGIRRKGDFHLFHTVEFHLCLLLIGAFLFTPVLFIFIGMLFHSLLDIYSLVQEDFFYRREYWLVHWILSK